MTPMVVMNKVLGKTVQNGFHGSLLGGVKYLISMSLYSLPNTLIYVLRANLCPQRTWLTAPLQFVSLYKQLLATLWYLAGLFWNVAFCSALAISRYLEFCLERSAGGVSLHILLRVFF